MDTARVALPHSRSPKAEIGTDGGAVPGSLPLTGMHLQFKRSDAQQADLDTLLAAQQNAASPLYHQWLTPDQFATRFGMADADIQKTEDWLTGQGFTIDGVSRSRNSIEFSGTAATVAQAFGAPLHYIDNGTERHFAPSSDITLPASLAAITLGIRDLDNFKPKPQAINHPVKLSPNFTSSQSGNHFLTPGDVATIYDLKPQYSAGFTGAGQTIAVLGESAIVTADITAFQTAAGLTVKNPTLLLVPNTGSSTLYTGDEGESDIDLEYAGGVAPGAQLVFVYTGNSNNNNGVFDSLYYAIDDRVAPIITLSYGGCEYLEGTAFITQSEAMLQQAAAQGQTFIASSGDDGNEGCYPFLQSAKLTTAQAEQLNVEYPASSAYATGVGGTQTAASALTVSTSTTQYWTGTTGTTDTISSALQYLPEIVWNETVAIQPYLSTAGPAAGGGGISTAIARPSWQTGVTGIPTGTYRLVPDIALQSSIVDPGFLYCSSDVTSTGVTGSCSSGFRAADGATLTEAGGTSFAAPIFAGMVAILNQARNSTGQGLLNTTLYSLASNATTYASAFHDITTGANNCPASTATTAFCGSAAQSVYNAGTGYDEATGLGSVDLSNLITAWPATAASALQASTTTVTPAVTAPPINTADTLTIKVAGSTTLSTVPTGTVTLLIDGGTTNGGSSATVTLAAGAASYAYAGSATAGAHTIVASYSGDSVFAASTSTTVLTIGGSSATGSFTLAGSAISVTAGSTGTSTITITPAGGYIGTVGFTVSANSSTLTNACYKIANAGVSSTAAATTTLTIGTNAATCSSLAVNGGGAMVRLGSVGAAENHAPRLPGSQHPFSLALTALGFGIVGWRKRRSALARSLMGFGLLAVLAMGASGCGSSSSSNTTSTNAPTGSYTLTVTGTDSSSSSITATTTVALTIH